MKRLLPGLVGAALGVAAALLLMRVLPPPNLTAADLRTEWDDYRVIAVSLLPMVGLVVGLVWARRRM